MLAGNVYRRTRRVQRTGYPVKSNVKMGELKTLDGKKENVWGLDMSMSREKELVYRAGRTDVAFFVSLAECAPCKPEEEKIY